MALTSILSTSPAPIRRRSSTMASMLGTSWMLSPESASSLWQLMNSVCQQNTPSRQTSEECLQINTSQSTHHHRARSKAMSQALGGGGYEADVREHSLTSVVNKLIPSKREDTATLAVTRIDPRLRPCTPGSPSQIYTVGSSVLRYQHSMANSTHYKTA